MYFNYFISGLILLICSQKNNSGENVHLLFEDDFSSGQLSDQWMVEKPDSEKNTLSIVDEKLELNSEGGITVWYKQKLKGNILIEYDRVVVMQGGVHDRLSDMNQFWMATDPQNRMFTRKGDFREYDGMQMYYVGMGGNYNSTTRMRRYDGKTNLRIVGEFTDSVHLLKPNYKYHIEIKTENGVNSFAVNGETYFSFKDDQPFTQGWFAIRSTKSRQWIDNVKIWQLK
jgi:rhamnogalacturonan endolyase